MSLNAGFTLAGKKMVEMYKFEYRGLKIFVDVKKRQYFEIDPAVDKVVDFLNGRLWGSELLKEYTGSDIYRVTRDLEARGLLDNPENRSKQDRMRYQKSPKEGVTNLILTLQPCCSDRCKYCFSRFPQTHKEKMRPMTVKVARQALDWFLEQAGNSEELRVQLCGAEPLERLPVLEAVVDYCRRLEDRFSKKILVYVCSGARGVEDKTILFLKGNRVFLQVTLDGWAEPLYSGRTAPVEDESYRSEFIKNIGELYAELEPERIIPRLTVTPQLYKLDEMADDLFSRGFKSLFYSTTPGFPKPATACLRQLGDIKYRLDILADKFIKKVVDGESYRVFPLGTRVSEIGVTLKRMYSQGRYPGYVAVDTNGDIFPGMNSLGREEFYLGNVAVGIDAARRRKVLKKTGSGDGRCSSCWVGNICGGVCGSVLPAAGDGMAWGRHFVTCELVKYMVKVGMYVNVQLSRRGIWRDLDNREELGLTERSDTP